MDLFNPEPNYNYIIMDKKIENLHLENPFIQVVWEDFAENFTQEKIKSVRFFFQKKWNKNGHPSKNLSAKTLANVAYQRKTSHRSRQKESLKWTYTLEIT